MSPILKQEKDGLSKLKRLVNSVSLRRTKANLLTDLHLPPRRNEDQYIQFSESERTVYNAFRRSVSKMANITLANHPSKSISVLGLITKLRRFCNHGASVLPEAMIERLKQGALSELELNAIIEKPSVCENCGELDPQQILQCLHLLCTACATSSGPEPAAIDACPLCPGVYWAAEEGALYSRNQGEDENTSITHPSTKILQLLSNLRGEQSQFISQGVKR